MPDHFHCVIQPALGTTISKIIQHIKGNFARKYIFIPLKTLNILRTLKILSILRFSVNSVPSVVKTLKFLDIQLHAL
jgi:REP element-mobilizing transposase RayT